MLHHVALTLALFLAPAAAQGPYYLQHTYAGASFLDAFTFDDSLHDARQSADWLANASYARAAGLAGVSPEGHVLLRVDNASTVVYNEKRASVSVTSAQAWGLGTLVVLDIRHAPTGCSVWPAFSSRSDTWPLGGGLNIYKSRNLETNSTITLSLDPSTSCVLEPSGTMLGAVEPGSQNCSDTTTECAVSYPASGAGTWVAELAESAISVWHFAPGALPQALDPALEELHDTAPLGAPAARFAFGGQAGCALGELIAPQRLVLSVSLCGLFADFTDAPGCPGRCYESYVLGPPALYDLAFFDIASLRIYTNTSLPSLSSSQPAWTQLAERVQGKTVLLVLAGCAGGVALALAACVAGWSVPLGARFSRGERRRRERRKWARLGAGAQ